MPDSDASRGHQPASLKRGTAAVQRIADNHPDMRAARFVVLLALLALAAPAQAAVRPAEGVAPKGLRGFLLRLDEPKSDVFPRTPSFAWRPVPGALRYEFELSTSSVFREGGIIYSDRAVLPPAASVPLALPWITGNPYALHARVRAVLRATKTPWSAPFGFNMRWPSIPQPLTTYPGLLRWTPIAGATDYDVWLVDAHKVFTVGTNVADQREHYTFHQDAKWTTSVRWKVRAVRRLYGTRGNRLPAVSYGPWSPTHTAVNPPFAAGPLNGSAAVSDVVSDVQAASAHGLMPAFVFNGNQTESLTKAELYRVYVFSDRDCVNVVYRGAIVGSPAYAPRPLGPLDLPGNESDLDKARLGYLKTGDEGATYTADHLEVKSSESEPATTSPAGAPTTGSPSIASGDGGAASAPSGTGGTGGRIPIDRTGGIDTSLAGQQRPEAPVDLWDTEWPQTGYYWTVVAVSVVASDSLSTELASVARSGSTAVVLKSAAGFRADDVISIGNTSNKETATIVSIEGTTVELSAPLRLGHASDEPVTRPEGDLEYHELELPQDVCATGRVMRFGKVSEPAVTVGGAPFASGLSIGGRLVAASETQTEFYGTPLVAWNPAPGAASYEVQWSKRFYPFQARGTAKTFSTSALLPLTPGTWYYRVRGVNLGIPGTGRQMTWSDPVKVVVARPRFRIVKK